MSNISWSYSSLKTFQQCPRKYYHLKIKKDVRDSGSEATLYGKELHKAAEDYIKDGVPIPERFGFIQGMLDSLVRIEGTKHCEYEMGLMKEGDSLSPCGFNTKGFWWRGIADLLIINEEKGVAHLVDYKTGKNAKFADTQQLDVLAAATFIHFPKIHTVKSALLFVVSKEFIQRKHTADMKLEYLEPQIQQLAKLEVAMQNDTWNPVTSGLCKFCPVTSCEHNTKGDHYALR